MKKSVKLISLILALLLTVSLFTGCNVQEQIETVGDVIMQEYPVTINGVAVNQKPKKVVVLTDELADAIIASGFETSLLAAPIESDHKNFQTLTKVDPNDTASIINLAPDLIISNVYTNEQLSDFQNAEITCVTISLAKNREDFERMYKEIGSVLGGSNTGCNKALENAQSVFRTLDDLSRIIPESNIVRTACYIFDLEDSGVTGDTLAGTVMNYLGLTNIFAGATDGVYNKEDLDIINPEFIFCPIGLKEEIMNSKDLKDISAVKNGKVFEIDAKLAKRNGRSIITFATTVAGIVYPELLEESTTVHTAMDPDEIADNRNEVLYEMGDTGEDITNFQKRLSQLGYFKGETTGVFDKETEKAILSFQEIHSLDKTGVMDELTLEMLTSDYVIESPDLERPAVEGYDPTLDAPEDDVADEPKEDENGNTGSEGAEGTEE